MPKRSRSKDSTHRRSLDTPQHSLSPLPTALQHLLDQFTRLNTLCTFWNAHLSSAITFTTLKASISDLEITHLAAIKTVSPHSLELMYLSDSPPVLRVQWGVSNGKQAVTHNKANVKPDTLRKTICTQNELFRKALERFAAVCQEKAVDVEEYLEQQSVACLPLLPCTDLSDVIETPPEKTTIEALIGGLSTQSFGCDPLDSNRAQKTWLHQSACYRDLQSSLPQEIMAALNKQGILKLYSHQADALDALHNKHHVIVTTCTASGKSLIYQLPVLKSLLENRSNKAMFLFPTKALAQDQLRSFQNLLSLCPSLSTVNAATFDGDTPLHQRRKIREEVDVLFTNPDMLHYAILPNASYWQGFLVGLCYSVIDEIHVYHGTLGAHVALVLRRLRRLCDRLGNTSVLFVSCSATIKHPEKHMKELLGVDSVQRIDQDGSPCGNKQFILWNPPLLSNTPQQVRKSAVTECASMLEYFLSCDIRTIVFCKTRKTCELLMKQMRDNVEQKQCQGQHHGQEKLKKVMSYRGGYTPHDRRRIEKQLFCGKLLCVIATNALELGIDIGSLDAVIMLGVPWSAAAMWQQSGRAGRQHTDSLSMVIAEDNPIDQYYMNNPSEFFEKKAEDLQLPIEDFAILASHLQCAAEELPIDIARDKEYFGDKLHSICQESLVSISNDQSLYRPHPRFRPYPSQFIQLRNITQETFAVVDVTDRRNVIIEEVETHRAPFEIYNGAIFIHQGLTYLVDECNVVQRYAKVHLVQVDWTTRQQDYTNVNTMSAIQSTSVHSTRNTVSYGKAQVETVVFGYHKINKQNKIIDTLEVFMDPVLMDVMAIWVDVPTPALDELAVLEIDIMAAIHSTAHALSNSLPQVLFSAADTLKTECKNPYATRKRPTKIILYESQSKSTVQKVYYNFDTFVQAAIKRVEDCSCELGCPTCIHLLTCSERNLFHSKKGAHIILKAIVGKDRHTE